METALNPASQLNTTNLPAALRKPFGIALMVLSLLASSAGMAQSVPTPWNGARDQSCEQYHSAKYKTPLYSAEAINDHLAYVLAVDNTPKLFYRWEGPVRYYLEVPPEYPELAKLFEEQVAQVAKYTGLDIARHDKPYLPYKDDKLNDKSKWPGGLSTNAMVIFTKDFKATVQTPQITLLVESMGGTVKQVLAEWNYAKKMIPAGDAHERLTYSYDPDRLVFMLQVIEPNSNFSNYVGLQSRSNKLARASFANAMSFSTKLFGGSKYLSTILNKDVYALTDFDKQFLRVLYGKHVHSGMLLIKAKRLVMEELIDCFNAKAGSVKR
ncbi:hypothetical protein [Rhodoferax saidenbachensis]|uniref:Uncharacterized protein n=1 Tax=Rhodoferax saidenbachensis TaxID=1484693 RepID=A0ABU1ZTJ5_9BURK|nr:hypothetical protein [Rhodoferax saidenbachensis]MDR7308261.1 hypothetical protein [Rhodoferax saidenbachensis]